MGAIVGATANCGAVRHGAECFNFGFPQELDDQFLLIWEEFDERPWRSTNLLGLLDFLKDRAEEGYAFPLNPVWPVRDEGWFEVYEALKHQSDPTCRACFEAWYPPESGIAERIERIHGDFGGGYSGSLVTPSASAAKEVLDLD